MATATLALGLMLGATIMLILMLRVGHSVIHPGTLMLVSWMGALFWQSLWLIQFEYVVLSPNTSALVMAFLVAFTAGSLVHLRMRITRNRPSEATTDIRVVGPIPALFLTLCLVVFAVCLIPTWQKFAGMGFSIAEARVQLWKDFGKTAHTPASALMAVTRPAAIFLAISIPIYWRRSRPMFLVSIMALVIIFLQDMASGGRTLTGFSVVGCFFTALSLSEFKSPHIFRAQSVWRLLGQKKTYAAIAGGLLLMYACFGVFPVLRNPNIAKHLEHYLHMHLGSGTQFSPHVDHLGKAMGRPDIKYFAYESRYLTAPMMRMNYLMNETDAPEWYFLGGNNFTIFSKVINLATMQKGYSLLDVKKRIKNSQPYGPNPWICGIMDIVIDFGVIGGVFFMFVAGCLCAQNYGQVMRSGQHEFIVVQALICVVIISFPYTCRLQSNTFTLTAMMAIGLAMVRTVRWLPK